MKRIFDIFMYWWWHKICSHIRAIIYINKITNAWYLNSIIFFWLSLLLSCMKFHFPCVSLCVSCWLHFLFSCVLTNGSARNKKNKILESIYFHVIWFFSALCSLLLFFSFSFFFCLLQNISLFYFWALFLVFKIYLH